MHAVWHRESPTPTILGATSPTHDVKKRVAADRFYIFILSYVLMTMIRRYVDDMLPAELCAVTVLNI